MELNLHVRHALPGETATHAYHARLGAVLPFQMLAESEYRYDAVLPCLVSVPSADAKPSLKDLTPNQIDLLLGALENMPGDMFGFQDREDRVTLLSALNELAESTDYVVPAEPDHWSEVLDAVAGSTNAYPEHEDGDTITIESNLD